MVEAGEAESQRFPSPAASVRDVSGLGRDPVHVAQPAAPGTKLSRETLPRTHA
jgi:hypothetical protein